MTISSRGYILWGILAVAVIVLLHRPSSLIPPLTWGDGEEPATLEVLQTNGGWGYRIVMEGKVLIHQPTIPAIDTIMPFPDETSARKVGSLVLKRFNARTNFSVSREEVFANLPN